MALASTTPGTLRIAHNEAICIVNPKIVSQEGVKTSVPLQHIVGRANHEDNRLKEKCFLEPQSLHTTMDSHQ